MSKQYLVLFIGAALIPASLASCAGYSIQLKTLKACESAPNPVIKFENPSIALDAQCGLTLTGCVEVTKAIGVIKGTYAVSKAEMPEPMGGEFDICEILGEIDDPEQMAEIEKKYNLPTTKCPFPEFKTCIPNDTKIDVSKYGEFLQMALGEVTGKIDIKHDTGDSCYDIELSVSQG